MIKRSLVFVSLVALFNCADRKDEASPDDMNMAKDNAGNAAPSASAPATKKMKSEALARVSAGEETDADDGEFERGAKQGFGSGAAPARKPEPAKETGARSRSWFPETFLFEPLVVTDKSGSATFDVTVPDRLTSWRVLALAHSRSGSQAGAVTQFLGTLPAYVDPILPPQLRVGDRIRVPVQLVNTTSEALRSTLSMRLRGGDLSAPPKAVNVPARGVVVVYATVTATRPGELELEATLGETDAVVRTARVIPVGKRIDVARSATLAAPRSLKLDGPPKSSDDRVRLAVFPGALAILRSELAASAGRGGLAANAFSLRLAGEAPSLLSKFGDEANADELRTLTILATQRIIRQTRVFNAESATLVALAAAAHEQNSILESLRGRAVAWLETNQLPDGTCGGETGWTLQRLLVATADCARAAADAPSVVARAQGAFERHGKQVNDPYTAAAILAASGAPDPILADRLRKMIREAAERKDDGVAFIKLPAGVVRADGRAPSALEASAMAALALRDHAGDEELVADLGAGVLAGYTRRRGWGDGRANLVATEALVEVFDQPVPKDIAIELKRDGVTIGGGKLDAESIRDVLLIEANSVGTSGSHDWEISATPAVPGLGFNLELSSWVPWPAPPRTAGLEIEAPAPTRLVAGEASVWRIAAAAPAGTGFEIELRLPAAVQADKAAIDALVTVGQVSSYEQDDERLLLRVKPLKPGQAFSAEVRVVPTIAGTIQSGAQQIRMDNVRVNAQPTTWNIK